MPDHFIADGMGTLHCLNCNFGSALKPVYRHLDLAQRLLGFSGQITNLVGYYAPGEGADAGDDFREALATLSA